MCVHMMTRAMAKKMAPNQIESKSKGYGMLEHDFLLLSSPAYGNLQSNRQAEGGVDVGNRSLAKRMHAM